MIYSLMMIKRPITPADQSGDNEDRPASKRPEIVPWNRLTGA